MIKEGKIMLERVPEIMTFNECKSLLKVGKNTLLNLLHNGDIDAFRIGNRWKIPNNAVIEYIKHL